MPEAIQSPSPLRVKNPCVHIADHADVPVRTQRGRWLRKERRNEWWEARGRDLHDLIVHMPRTAAQRRKHVNHPTYCCALEINASREYGCVPSVANEGTCKQENGWGRCVCVAVWGLSFMRSQWLTWSTSNPFTCTDMRAHMQAATIPRCALDRLIMTTARPCVVVAGACSCGFVHGSVGESGLGALPSPCHADLQFPHTFCLTSSQ
jgi:hypothetical protein